MNNQVLNQNGAVFYVVMANGKALTERRTTREQAVADIQNLSENLKTDAQIVPVDCFGRQVLLG